jgi:hypothetical protein
MPTLSIKGATGTVRTRREGSNVVVEKTIDKAILIETHKGDGKRARGKQAPGKPITLSATEVKGFENNTEARIREALSAGTEENKKTIAAINAQANRFGAMLEKKHEAETETMKKKVQDLTNKLVAVKQAKKKQEIALTKTPEAERIKVGMNMLANQMLEKKDKEHAAELRTAQREHEEKLKKAVDRRKEFQRSTFRLRKERDRVKTEVAELKARLSPEAQASQSRSSTA